MAPAWRGLPAGPGAARAHDVAEFCASCWRSGLYPGLLYPGDSLLDDLVNSCAKQMQDVATVAEQVRIHWPLLLSPVSSLSPPLMSFACAVPAPPRFAAGEVDLLLQAAAEWATEWAAATDFDQPKMRTIVIALARKRTN
eukprot:COSAG03_NODE_3299_length_2096_cov_1.907361_1_plen_140_part_00